MCKEHFTNSPYSILNATNITILYSKLKVSLSLGPNDRLGIRSKLGISKSQLLWVLARLNPMQIMAAAHYVITTLTLHNITLRIGDEMFYGYYKIDLYCHLYLLIFI